VLTYATQARQQGPYKGRKRLDRRGAMLKLRANGTKGQGQEGHLQTEPGGAHVGKRTACTGGIHCIAKGAQLVLYLVCDSL